MADNFNTGDRATVSTTTVVTQDSAGNAMPAALEESTVIDAAGNLVSIIQTDGVSTWITTVTIFLNTPSSGLTKKTFSRPVKQ